MKENWKIEMKKMKTGWKVIGTVLGTIVAMLGVYATIVGLWGRVETWPAYDYIRDEADERKIRVLVAELRYDEKGRYRAEIEKILREDRKLYRRLGRVWEPDMNIGESEEKVKEDRDKIKELLRTHRSNIFIHGEVGAIGKEIRLTVVKSDGRQTQKIINIENKRADEFAKLIEEWLIDSMQQRTDSLRPRVATVEEHVKTEEQLESLLDQIKGGRGEREARFQLAFVKSELAFWTGDEEKKKESVREYEELLQSNLEKGEDRDIKNKYWSALPTRGVDDRNYRRTPSSN